MAAQPVYQLFQMKFSEAWYQLPEAEQKRLGQVVDQALDKAGGKRIVVCDSRWHNDQWDGWGVEVYPNLAAVQEMARLQRDLGWYRYYDGVAILGTARQGVTFAPIASKESQTAAQPVYKVFKVGRTEAWYQMSKEGHAQLRQADAEAFEKVRAKPILFCESRWHSERWLGWGLEEFPSIEALQEYTGIQHEIDWHRYHESESLLGTAWQD